MVEDGFGNAWPKCGPACDLEVVRPGKVQCSCRSMENVLLFPVFIEPGDDDPSPDGGAPAGGFVMRGGWQDELPLDAAA